MENDKEKLAFLIAKLDDLAARQKAFENEISNLKQEIRHLQSPNDEPFLLPPKPAQKPQEVIFPPKNSSASFEFKQRPPEAFPPKPKSRLVKSDFEKFIGENLI